MLTRRGFVGALASALAAGGCRETCADADLNADPDGLLDLADGLAYVVVDMAGDPMSDGHPVPERPDGMGCFDTAEGWVLVRNHELPPPTTAPDASPLAFDPADIGGVSRVVLDPATLAVRSSNLVLTGVRMPCGGGQTPHGWLACEETRDPGHGWVFLCDPAADGLREPVRIGAYGRMRHEAAVLDASSGRAWLTEDEPDGCLYRYVPDDPTEPFGPGRLQALAVDGLTDTTPLATGTVLDVSWVDLPPTDGTLRSEAAGLGAARFARGEGAWLRDGRLVFTATSGGPALAGQIFALDVESDVLTVLYASADLDDLLRPDNLTILADGRVVVCEDHGCPCRLHVLGSDGSLTPIARSVLEGDELAGVCPSPDGRVLFVNLYRTGVTLAITGL